MRCQLAAIPCSDRHIFTFDIIVYFCSFIHFFLFSGSRWGHQYVAVRRFIYTVATCKFHKLLQIFFLLLLKQQSFFILQANSTRTFLRVHVLFLQRKTRSFSIKKKKVNKRTKICNYVKRENVAIATTTFSDFDVLVFCSRTFYGSCYLF